MFQYQKRQTRKLPRSPVEPCEETLMHNSIEEEDSDRKRHLVHDVDTAAKRQRTNESDSIEVEKEVAKETIASEQEITMMTVDDFVVRKLRLQWQDMSRAQRLSVKSLLDAFSKRLACEMSAQRERDRKVLHLRAELERWQDLVAGKKRRLHSLADELNEAGDDVEAAVGLPQDDRELIASVDGARRRADASRADAVRQLVERAAETLPRLDALDGSIVEPTEYFRDLQRRLHNIVFAPYAVHAPMIK
jgi:chromosome segregation ATPase